MSSQKGIFPKRSLGKNPKIDPLFPPTTKPHPLNPLTVGPPLLYWLDTNGWCFGPCVCVLLPSAFVFLYSHAISAVLAMSHYAVCLLCSCYPPRHEGRELLGLYYFLLFPCGLGHWLGRSPYIQSVGLLLLLLLFLPCL